MPLRRAHRREKICQFDLPCPGRVHLLHHLFHLFYLVDIADPGESGLKVARGEKLVGIEIQGFEDRFKLGQLGGCEKRATGQAALHVRTRQILGPRIRFECLREEAAELLEVTATLTASFRDIDFCEEISESQVRQSFRCGSSFGLTAGNSEQLSDLRSGERASGSLVGALEEKAKLGELGGAQQGRLEERKTVMKTHQFRSVSLASLYRFVSVFQPDHLEAEQNPGE